MPTRHSLLTVFCCLLAATVAHAQCAPSWAAPAGFGCDGEVMCAVEWDPDGSGPAPAELVVGGSFQRVCGTAARNLARVDLQLLTATPFGAGANGTVGALATGLAGELIVGGAFTQIDGIPAVGIANFGGGAWNAYGSGVDVSAGGPRAILPQLGGALVVGGHLGSAGNVPVSSVARWDGVAWSAMGAGLRPVDTLQPLNNEQGGVRALISSPNGVIAVGVFDASGTQTLSGVAEWNGVAWSPVGSALGSSLAFPTAGVRAANGDLFVCGFAIFAPLPSFVMKWDGVTWTTLPPNTGIALVMAAMPSGNVVVSGPMSTAGCAIEEWDGTSWQVRGSVPLQLSVLRVRTVAAMPSIGTDTIFVGGRAINEMQGVAAHSMLLHSPALGWIGDAQATRGPNAELHIGPGGEVLLTAAVGYGVTPLPGIGVWNGSSFGPFPSSPSSITAVAFDHRGGVVVAATSVIHRWDGSGWTSLGDPGVGQVDRLAVLSDDLVVAVNAGGTTGRFWRGGTWRDLGAAPFQMVAHPDGRLIAVSTIGALSVPGRVAAWDGATWTALDPAVNIDGPPQAVAVMPNGDIVVGGGFTFGNRIARFDGVSWRSMGAGFNGNVLQLLVLADGRLLAGGSFTQSGATPCPGLAIFDGVAWGALPDAPNGTAKLAAHPNGDLWGIVDRRIVRFVTPCPAVVTSQPTACTNAAAAGYLEAPRWPMIGSVSQCLVSGLQSSSLAAMVVGLSTPPLPLTSLFPPASPGCDIRVSADIVVYAPTSTGFARFDIPVPNAPALVGFTVVEQGAGITGLGSSILGATSTNSLALTIGSRQ